MSEPGLVDVIGRLRSPAATPGHWAGCVPPNKGLRYPADPPTVEEIILVMREAGLGPYADRLRGLIAILWRAGLRISDALALTESDLDPRIERASLLRAKRPPRRRDRFRRAPNRDLGVLSRVLEGLEGKDVNVIATVGPDRDPDALGPQPANIHLFGYVPQAQLLGRCDLVICQGGASSTFGALSFGLPRLILPRGADNFYNAERVLSAGAGRSLLDAEITAEAVANEVAFLLTDDNCHNAAALIADEITALPAPARAVTALENLAATRPSSPSASLASW